MPCIFRNGLGDETWFAEMIQVSGERTASVYEYEPAVMYWPRPGRNRICDVLKYKVTPGAFPSVLRQQHPTELLLISRWEQGTAHSSGRREENSQSKKGKKRASVRIHCFKRQSVKKILHRGILAVAQHSILVVRMLMRTSLIPFSIGKMHLPPAAPASPLGQRGDHRVVLIQAHSAPIDWI